MEENNNNFKELKKEQAEKSTTLGLDTPSSEKAVSEAKEEIKAEFKEDVLKEIKAQSEAKTSAVPTASKPESEPEPKPEIPETKPVVPAKKPKPTKPFNWWALGAVIFFMLSVAAIFTGGFSSITGMSAFEAGEKAVNFLNQELLPPGTEASLVDAKPESGVYNLLLDISGEQYNSYVTKDGNLFFISGIGLNKITGAATGEPSDKEPAPSPAAFDAPDSKKPQVQLFVMSFCPYGQQAENNLVSAMDLLGDSVDFEPHFIVRVTDNTTSSLHGSKEVDEDMRQACIWKYYPETWWDYVLYVNENIPLDNINEKWTEAAEAAGLDADSIETCVEQEGLELLKADDELTSELGITSSPTILINGERYSRQRTPDALKQAICSGFEEQPDTCSETLESSSSSSSTGSC